jgi:copper oxidase (laccase) domain-containing protein
MGASHLALLHQTHSDTVVDLRVREQIAQDLREYGDLMKRREGDAVLLARQDEGEMQIAAGVMTADCVPIVVRSRDEWALIHAGWRGLANGIITKALKCLKGDIREAAVFAAAGPPEYEVGEEVIAAIGSPAVFTSTSAGRFALDTAATAAKQLGSFAPNAAIAVAGISTITDKRFHSYRRNGEAAGRSVTFVVPPPTLKEQG